MIQKEARGYRKERKHRERLAAERQARIRRLARHWGLYVGLALLAVGGGGFVVRQAATARIYPPTSMQDHVESYPPCRICATPIPEAIQKHILEHREPGGASDRPGILVQYSCAPCPEVVAQLTRIVERYPRGVYLAPYPAMTPRVALTTLGRVEALDGVDEARITAFIEKYL